MPNLLGDQQILKDRISHIMMIWIHFPIKPSGKYITMVSESLHVSYIKWYTRMVLQEFASTFLIFSEYAKNAIRMSALMKLPIIYIFTHDSIGLNGPHTSSRTIILT